MAPADVFIGSRIVDCRMQQLNVNNSDSHITSSQPNQEWVSPIVYMMRDFPPRNLKLVISSIPPDVLDHVGYTILTD